MDVVEIEAWSFLKQQILRRIYFVSAQMGLQPLSRPVIDDVVSYFCGGSPVWNVCLRTMVVRLAFSIHIAPYQS